MRHGQNMPKPAPNEMMVFPLFTINLTLPELASKLYDHGYGPRNHALAMAQSRLLRVSDVMRSATRNHIRIRRFRSLTTHAFQRKSRFRLVFLPVEYVNSVSDWSSCPLGSCPFKSSRRKEQRAWSVRASVRHGRVPHGAGHLSAFMTGEPICAIADGVKKQTIDRFGVPTFK